MPLTESRREAETVFTFQQPNHMRSSSKSSRKCASRSIIHHERKPMIWFRNFPLPALPQWQQQIALKNECTQQKAIDVIRSCFQHRPVTHDACRLRSFSCFPAIFQKKIWLCFGGQFKLINRNDEWFHVLFPRAHTCVAFHEFLARAIEMTHAGNAKSRDEGIQQDSCWRDSPAVQIWRIPLNPANAYSGWCKTLFTPDSAFVSSTFLLSSFFDSSIPLVLSFFRPFDSRLSCARLTTSCLTQNYDNKIINAL
jgi:hypothetical protein